MRYAKLMIAGVVAPALLIGACNRNPDSRDSVVGDATATADEAARNQQQRDEEIARLDQRVAEIEREYAEADHAGKGTPTAALREAIKEDVTNVKQAVTDLRTTTPTNWWSRHEEATRRTADDIEADVAKLAGKVLPARPATTAQADGEAVSTEPFTSQRDRFVAEMRTRVDAMKQALDTVKARGPRETELDDLRARVAKLEDDVDRLQSASADDWWDVTKSRVTEYVDRIDESVERLDDRG